MKTYPLKRRKLTNEHFMAALFVVIVLYEIPVWIKRPTDILGFLVVLATGLLIETTANFMRYKRPVCSVSAAVSAGIIQVLCNGVPLWALVLGVAFAMLMGKHVFGGMGKNVLNPAILAVLFLGFAFHLDIKAFQHSLILIPAILLSLPFLGFRPFAGGGLILGMVAALLMSKSLDYSNIAAYGVFFWGCIVITDPVTSTPRPLTGIIGGFITGFLPLYLDKYFGYSVILSSTAILLLAYNLISYFVDKSRVIPYFYRRARLRIRKAVPDYKGSASDVRTFGTEIRPKITVKELKKHGPEELLQIIHDSKINGLGGAGYPAYLKIKAFIKSKAKRKYLVVNCAECDPGLVHDHWLIRNLQDEVYKGVELLRGLADFEAVILAVKDRKGINPPRNIVLKGVSDYYPVGAERILIKEVLGKTVFPEQFPSNEGILVLNVQTVYSIYHAIYDDKYEKARYLTVANLKEGKSQVVKAGLDVPVKDIADAVFPGEGPIFKGGGMMQACLAEGDEKIGDTINFIAVGEAPRYKESPLCSKCYICVENCPVGLNVCKIANLVDEERYGLLFNYTPQKCIGCGSCSYVCLAGRKLSTRVKKAKDYVKTTKVRKAVNK